MQFPGDASCTSARIPYLIALQCHRRKSIDFCLDLPKPDLGADRHPGVLTGLLAGAYPAFYLTSFNAVTAIKGMKLFKTNFGALLIRNGLVVLQFGISIALIICTLIVFKQLKYTQEKNLGFDKENVVVLSYTKRLGNQEEAFRQELVKQRYIINASISSSIPTKGNFGD